jgi:hypothetical protein
VAYAFPDLGFALQQHGKGYDGMWVTA